MLARDQPIRSASPKRFSERGVQPLPDPACCQSRKRRQQVMPEPQPTSCGRYSQRMPVFSTNRMPVKTARSGTRGRPGFSLSQRGGGSSGATTAQSSSLTNGLAIPHRPQAADPFC